MNKDFGKQTNQTRNEFSELGLVQSSVSISTKNAKKSKSCPYIYKCGIVNQFFFPGNTSFNPGNTSFGLGTTSFELGNTSFELGNTSFGLGTISFDPGITSIGLGNPSFVLGTTSFELGTHILLSGRHLLRWGAHLFTRGLTFWLWGNIFPFPSDKPGDCSRNCVVAGKGQDYSETFVNDHIHQ